MIAVAHKSVLEELLGESQQGSCARCHQANVRDRGLVLHPRHCEGLGRGRLIQADSR